MGPSEARIRIIYWKGSVMEKFFQAVGAGLVVMVTLVFIAFIGAYPTKWTVNYVFNPAVLVAVFGGPLSVWKAMALNFVAASLIKSNNVSEK